MKLYNTLSRQIEKISPLEAKKIKMYSCGLTVYSQPQIGNWVAYIYSDILTRTLIHHGYEVNRIQNITDVGHLVSDDDQGEDKMEKGARREGKTAWEVADKYIEIAENEGFKMLGLLKPNKLVRATDLINEQIEFAKILEAKGFTYLIENEGLYFDSSKFPTYGDLANLDIEGLKAGARVDIKGKMNITDFALWKLSPQSSTRDMEWDSPWGIGFPGWHLECSVIAYQNLGEQIDIHTGGIDHIPVHHTNEIAQTESVTGKKFSKIWFHNNHIKINGEKLSKSSGNSYNLDDLIKKGYSLDSFKLMVISSHYRTEGNFSFEILDAAQNRITNWKMIASLVWQPSDDEADTDLCDAIDKACVNLVNALENDINTPDALKVTDELFSAIQLRNYSASTLKKLSNYISLIETLLNINIRVSDISSAQLKLIEQREIYRSEKNWDKSDELRDVLKEENITLNDFSDGTVWSKV